MREISIKVGTLNCCNGNVIARSSWEQSNIIHLAEGRPFYGQKGEAGKDIIMNRQFITAENPSAASQLERQGSRPSLSLSPLPYRRSFSSPQAAVQLHSSVSLAGNVHCNIWITTSG